MKRNYFVIALSIFAIATLSAAIVTAEHHPANTNCKHPANTNCKKCHNYGGEIPDLHSKQNNQQDGGVAPVRRSVASVSLTSTEYHHVDHCVVCHDMSGSSSNLYLIFEVINTPNSGLKDVIFTEYEGTNSYADGDTTYNGVCEVCHTQTRHHRNDGNNPDPDHYANTSCIECHSHFNEFSHGGGSGSGCEDCHGHDPGYEYEPGNFSEGAGTIKSHSTHTQKTTTTISKVPIFRAVNATTPRITLTLNQEQGMRRTI